MFTENRIGQKITLVDHGDGLADIYMAMILLSFGLGIRLDMGWLSGIVPALMLPLWYSIKSGIVDPRLEGSGQQPESEAHSRMAYKGIVMLVTGALLLGMIFFALPLLGGPTQNLTFWLRQNIDQVLGILLAIFLAGVGLVISARRFYAYAVLCLLIFLAGNTISLPLWVSAVLTGGLILLAGSVIFVRFIRRNPLREES